MRPPLTFVLAAAVSTSVIARQQPTFRAGVDAVRVDVSVTDHGKAVRGLTAQDFVVADNGTPEPVTSVTLEQLPLRVVLLLDTSGSVEGSAMQTLVDASRGLIWALRPTDRIAVVTFSGEVTLLGGFDAARPAVLEALGHVHAGGTTALYDALQIAFELVRMDDAKVAARPLIVVCTDGVDIGSWLSGDDVVEGARRADVVVHIIQPAGAPTSGPVKHVNTVADVSGGRRWSATSERDLKGLFTQTLTEMRDRYLLTFTPDSPVRAGWHDLKVSLKRARGAVLARPGYYVSKNADGSTRKE
jgi:VWFA-related protein